MGAAESKTALMGDVKFMENYSAGSTVFLKQWNKDHGFTGKLTKTDCERLMGGLKATAAGKKGKARKNLDEQIRVSALWVNQAEKRAEGKKETTVAASVSMSSDEETGASTSAIAAKKRRERELREEEEERDRRSKEREDRDRKERERRARDKIQRELDKLQIEGYEKPNLAKTRSQTKDNLHPNLDMSQREKEGGGAAGGELYPLVQVANPHYGVGTDDEHLDNERTISVYRPWTAEDCRKACEGLTPYKQNATQFCLDHEALVQAYQLNGHEVLRTLLNIFGHEWGRVKGQFTGADNAGARLAVGAQALINQTNAVYVDIARVFAQRPDYTKISGCREEEKESVQNYRVRLEGCFNTNSGIPYDANDASPYQQQLKQALMNGFSPGIAEFIRKQNVNHRTGSVQECMNYAEHAANYINEKRKKKVATFLVSEDGEGEVFYMGGARGRGSNRGRGRGRGRGGRNEEGRFLCYRCGKEGHMARDCRANLQGGGGQGGQYRGNQSRADERPQASPPHNPNHQD